MRRVKLVLCYDGTGYRGFQRQPEGPTIQAVLEDVLGRILDEPVKLRPAGRTDAGVHAREQVADFADSGRRPLETIVRGGNALLPPDIRIVSAVEAAPDFDARRRALFKEYRYFLHLDPVASPFLSRYAWQIEKPIDAGAVAEALSHVVGEHDFTSFRGQGCTAKSPVRRIDRAVLSDCLPPLRYISVTGTGFLRHMVRNIVGTVVEAGQGKIPPGRVREILAAKDRTRAGVNAPARGLFLWSVGY